MKRGILIILEDHEHYEQRLVIEKVERMIRNLNYGPLSVVFKFLGEEVIDILAGKVKEVQLD